MSENDELKEGTGETPQLAPTDEAKEAMREAIEAFGETVATPRPPERIDVPVRSEEEPHGIDLNLASEEELRRLPGIGPVLAARIIQHRTEVGPFRDPAEILAVTGLSDSTYQGIAGRLVVSTAQAPEEVGPETVEPEFGEAEEGETVEFEEVAEGWEEVEEPEEALPVEPEEAVAAEPEPEAAEMEEEVAVEAEEAELVEPELEAAEVEEAVPAASEAEARLAEVKRKRWPDGEPPLEVVPARRGVGWGGVLFVGLVSALIGALLALGTLWIVNRTLDFQTATDRAVRAEAFRVDGEMAALGTDLDGMRGRLEALQEMAPQIEQAQIDIRALSTDLGVVVTQLGQLKEDLVSAETELTTLGGEVAGLGSEVESLGGDVATLEVQVGGMEEQLTALQEEFGAIREAAERFDVFLLGLRDLLESSLPPGEEAPAPRAETPQLMTPTPTPTPTPASETQTATPSPMITVIPLGTPTTEP